MKQFLKRLTALLLLAALCTALLSGCAKDGEGMALSVCTGAAPESLDPIYAELSLIHMCRCRRLLKCSSRWAP